MKIGKVHPIPVIVPKRIERKVRKEKPIPVQMPVKKEQDVPAKA